MVDEFNSENGKTRETAAVVSKWPCRKPVIIADAWSKLTLRSARNIPNLALRTSDGVAPYDVLAYDECVMTRKGYDKLIARLKARSAS